MPTAAAPAFTVKRFDELSTRELYDLLQARVAVFVVEQECPYQELDGVDAASLHVYSRNADGGISSYLRIFDKPGEPGVVQIGRVLTMDRGTGLGGAVLDEGLRVAREHMGAREVYIEAQVYAKGFYERVGFETSSDEFDEDGIPHVQMRRTL